MQQFATLYKLFSTSLHITTANIQKTINNPRPPLLVLYSRPPSPPLFVFLHPSFCQFGRKNLQTLVGFQLWKDYYYYFILLLIYSSDLVWYISMQLLQKFDSFLNSKKQTCCCYIVFSRWWSMNEKRVKGMKNDKKCAPHTEFWLMHKPQSSWTKLNK